MSYKKTEDELRRVYLKTYFRGRSKAARIIDGTAEFVMVGIVFWLAVRTKFRNLSVSLLLTAALIALFGVIRKAAVNALMKRHIKGLRTAAAEETKIIKATLDIEELLSEITDRNVYKCASTESVTADDVLAAHRAGCDTIASLASPTEEATRLMGYLNVKTVSPFDMPRCTAAKKYRATKEETDERLIKEYGRNNKKNASDKLRGLRVFSRERSFRYILTGAGLLLLSFFVRYSLYYRLLGSLSMSLGAAVFAFETAKNKART